MATLREIAELCQIFYFTSARILNSTTAQLAKVEAVPEFPWRTAIRADGCTTRRLDSIEHFTGGGCSYDPAGGEKQGSRWTGHRSAHRTDSSCGEPVATVFLNRFNDGFVETSALKLA